MNKADTERKKALARTLYLSGKDQTEIAEQVGINRCTINRWCNAEGWKEVRAAKNITRPELVNKLLMAIDKLIEQVNESEDAIQFAGLADKLSKLSTTISRLDKKANIVDAIEVFMAFSDWLEQRAPTDPNLTSTLIKDINKYQDKYILENSSK